MYEIIDIRRLSLTTTHFFDERKTMPDNSVILIRYNRKEKAAPEFRLVNKYYGGAESYSITIPNNQRNVDAIVLLCRTSKNNYAITGYTYKGIKMCSATSLEDVDALIKEHFCKTLDN